MPTLKLRSSDGVSFEVDVEVLKCSEVIQVILEDFWIEEGGFVPLSGVNSGTLEKVIRWATHHKDDPQPPNYYAEISEWDQQFLNDLAGAAELDELILAAYHLKIEGLTDLCQKHLRGF